MKRITDPTFKWIPASSHDADSRPFYERQMQRIREANEARGENKQVVSISRKKALAADQKAQDIEQATLRG